MCSVNFWNQQDSNSLFNGKRWSRDLLAQVAYSGSKVEWEEIFEIWDTTRTPRAVVLFLEIFENAITFATGNCQKFKPEVLVYWRAPSRRPRLRIRRERSVSRP